MPRLARLDAPGVLHHVIGRGIERKEIFFHILCRTQEPLSSSMRKLLTGYVYKGVTH
ncbi:MAG: hypothetical protein ISS68_14530 [Desulfobacteraceae bacterium]|nr:hypothetical protein [Desulfobacteraceae bacterium]